MRRLACTLTIGDIIVTSRRGKAVDLNLWMAQKGWAFPSFYASMSEAEISRFRKAAAAAQRKKLGIWKGYRSKLSFDPRLVYRDVKCAREAGPVSMPKIFRRLAADWVSNGNTQLHAFLTKQRSPERCYKTDEFLEHGITVARQYDLAELVLDTGVKFKPGDVVFQEAASALYDRRNKKIVA